jgi:tRNA (cytidine/uridine-2'-O-)-methyltransferase
MTQVADFAVPCPPGACHEEPDRLTGDDYLDKIAPASSNRHPGTRNPGQRQMRLALYQPDIPQNAGALIRLGACLGVPVDIIEPCGFLFSDGGFRRAGMDYLGHADVTRHESWDVYLSRRSGRLILLTTKASLSYTALTFMCDDTLLLGRESAGVPDQVHARADARVRIPLGQGLRSLNVAQAGAMVLGEALRQTESFPA